jgi:hypothetical protein
MSFFRFAPMNAKFPPKPRPGRTEASPHVPETPNYWEIPAISPQSSLFGSYVTVLRCWTCGWRGYEQPWPSECGKCGGWVILDRAPAEPAQIPNKRIRLI